MTTPNITANSSPVAKSHSFTRHLPTIARVLMGLFLLVSGIVGLLGLTPPPPSNLPEAAIAFNAGAAKTGYMMPLIFGTQTLVGALLLSNRFVPLALALIAPFLVNSFAFHLFLVPAGLVIIAVLGALELYLAWTYRAAFLPMLAARVVPGEKLTPIT